MKSKSCRKCGEPVCWVVTNNGKRTMLDAEPDPAEGTVAIIELKGVSGSTEVAVAVKDSEVPERGIPLLEVARANRVPLHRVHFFHCAGNTGGAS